jgi:hypothetical protein
MVKKRRDVFAAPNHGQSTHSNDRYGGGTYAPVHYSGFTSSCPGLRIEVVPWTEHAYDQLTGGDVDSVFSPIAPPPPSFEGAAPV